MSTILTVLSSTALGVAFFAAIGYASYYVGRALCGPPTAENFLHPAEIALGGFGVLLTAGTLLFVASMIGYGLLAVVGVYPAL